MDLVTRAVLETSQEADRTRCRVRVWIREVEAGVLEVSSSDAMDLLKRLRPTISDSIALPPSPKEPDRIVAFNSKGESQTIDPASLDERDSWEDIL